MDPGINLSAAESFFSNSPAFLPVTLQMNTKRYLFSPLSAPPDKFSNIETIGYIRRENLFLPFQVKFRMFFGKPSGIFLILYPADRTGAVHQCSLRLHISADRIQDLSLKCCNFSLRLRVHLILQIGLLRKDTKTGTRKIRDQHIAFSSESASKQVAFCCTARIFFKSPSVKYFPGSALPSSLSDPLPLPYLSRSGSVLHGALFLPVPHTHPVCNLLL